MNNNPESSVEEGLTEADYLVAKLAGRLERMVYENREDGTGMHKIPLSQSTLMKSGSTGYQAMWNACDEETFEEWRERKRK